ncbi:MAG: hypothetical protein EBZ48_02555 [Proteobacteria bacterium]|nr:hypothetical protein [Pseudomonadota bacterium]
MTTIVIVENGASSEAMEKTVAAARFITDAELSVIANAATLSSLEGVMGFDLSRTVRSSLAAAVDMSSSATVMILDARLAPEGHELQSLLGEMNRSRGFDYLCASLRRGTTMIELPSLTADNIVEVLSSGAELPLMCVAIRKDSALKIAPFEGENLPEILTRLLVKGTLRGQAASATRYSIAVAREHSLNLDDASISRTLRAITAEINIEDLFPSHPWTEHDEESAAAAYQTLAALFVRFGDLEAAADCLRISDTLEDSPRSLALKGMIAQLRGETLGAVANMVASLQQYEIRKHANNNHYVQYSPGNVEKISSSMQAGLSALNRADNEVALEFFSQAVFSFDPFFKETGLEAKPS